MYKNMVLEKHSCKKCGARIRRGSSFCHKCGAKLKKNPHETTKLPDLGELDTMLKDSLDRQADEIESLQKRSEKNVLSEGDNLSENPAAIVTNDLSQQANSSESVSIERSHEHKKLTAPSNDSSLEGKIEVIKQHSPTDTTAAHLFSQVASTSELKKSDELTEMQDYSETTVSEASEKENLEVKKDNFLDKPIEKPSVPLTSIYSKDEGTDRISTSTNRDFTQQPQSYQMPYLVFTLVLFIFSIIILVLMIWIK
ncbi:MAG: zinc ribbon domain-containing protein [Acidobacteria bacterium]|nr:MAG: zinc ribbon domain-containing protein [Acidobacteriota bacterium]